MFDDHGFPVPDGVLTGVAGADGDEDLVETGPFVIEIEDDGVGAVASLDQSWVSTLMRRFRTVMV